ncbi:hypothetical protein HF078_12415 [Bacillus sp. RO2]|uniref:hypothetical protein n=1 Tax=Bacillus sp. RO2 TaxID=2723913 RepID=UPI00145F2844|nr:hypothetical protein [Bacillus sp. RO2]NMH73887.1 hypothetical protein [Bacillus sp. RO2]
MMDGMVVLLFIGLLGTTFLGCFINFMIAEILLGVNWGVVWCCIEYMEELKSGVSPPRGGFNYFVVSFLGGQTPQTPPLVLLLILVLEREKELP